MNYQFKLPDIGEGLTEGEVTRWHVKEGDAVKENQPLCNVLTDKAEVEVPSPKAGIIVKLHAAPGEKVKVHKPLVSFQLAGTTSAARPTVAPTSTPVASRSEGQPAARGQASGQSVSATPMVRQLAKSLGVDI